MVKKLSSRPRSGSVDRYLHALLLLTDGGRQADTGDVAVRVGVSTAGASQMLKNLADKGMVRLEPYQGAELTPEGMHRALRVVRRHRLLELFLQQVMGFDLAELHARAMALEPVIDEAFEEKLDAMMDRPKVDPHGQPIPSRNATWPKLSDAALLELPPGASGLVSRITTEDSEAIKYLHGLGVRPGAPLVLEHLAPFDGPVTIQLSKRPVHLGRRLAQMVHVTEAPSSRKGGSRIRLVRSAE